MINWMKRLIVALLDAAVSKLCVQIDLLVYIISRFLFLFTYKYIDFDIIYSRINILILTSYFYILAMFNALKEKLHGSQTCNDGSMYKIFFWLSEFQKCYQL